MPEKALLIAEKSSLMRTIESVYNDNKDKIPFEIDFVAQRGHLVELLMPEEIDEELKEWSWDTLPFHPEEHGGWKYKVKNEKRVNNYLTAQERYENIKDAIDSGEYDFIINAGDPDQEGQLLIQLVLDKVGNTLPVKRFWTNDTTSKVVLNELLNLRNNEEDYFRNILDAAKARQFSDYRFGMNLSRAATLKMDGLAAIGRVKTPILNIVVQRENQIRNFKEETTYGVKLKYGDDLYATLFVPSDNSSNPNKEDEDEDIEDKEEAGIVWFKTKKEAEDLIATLANKSKVEEFSTKETKQKPPKLFKMVTLQSAAGKAFGYETKKTDEIIQSLYEMKLLTYPRTDCEYVSTNEDFLAIIESVKDHPELKEYAENITQEDVQRVKSSNRWANDKEVGKAGHTALIPTSKSMSDIELTKDQMNIYTLVARQFLSIFMKDLIQNKIEMITSNNGNMFKTTGKTLIDPGYTKIFDKVIKDKDVPTLEKGKDIDIKSKEVSTKKTTCPKRFTSFSLSLACDNPLKYLEDESLKRLGKSLEIGTPASRTSIIQELIKKDKYMENVKNGKRTEIKPTKAGEILIENLEGFDITKVDMTGMWEEELTKVRNGELDFEELNRRMILRVNDSIKQFQRTDMKAIPSTRTYSELTDCPRCGGKIIEGPKVFFCSNNREKGCKVGGFKNVYGAEITSSDFLKMLNGEKIEKEMAFADVKTGKVNKWKQKVGLNEQGTITPIVKKEDTGWTCKACGKKIIESDRNYYCEGKIDKTCNVFVSKHFAGKTISEDDFKKLFTEGETGILKDLESNKDGKKSHYDGKLYIKEDEKEVGLKFVERLEKTDLDCPVCSKPIIKNKFKYICSGNEDNSCHFQMYINMFKKPIPQKTVKELFAKVKSGEFEGGEDAFITPNGPIKTGHTCPFCGDEILRENMKFTCAGVSKGTCKFETFRNVGTHILDDKEFDVLLTAGKTEPIYDLPSKKGGTYDARGILNWDKQKMEMEYVNTPRPTKYDCPICKNKLTKNGRKLECQCGFNCWTKVCGKDLTEKNLDDLFTKGKTGYISGFKKKDGSKMSPARVVINYEGKTTGLAFKRVKHNEKQ